MTQEQKQLLLIDLCGRLPYGVKCQVQEDEFTYIGTLCKLEIDNANGNLLDFAESVSGLEWQVYLSEVKPYLFPLSSMTEEQKNDCPINETTLNIINSNIGCYGIIEIPWRLSFLFIDWCNKNHFDYRGLIPKDLANDATGLNIYQLWKLY